MFRILAVAAFVGIVMFILGVFLGAQRHKEPEEDERDIKCFLPK